LDSNQAFSNIPSSSNEEGGISEESVYQGSIKQYVGKNERQISKELMQYGASISIVGKASYNINDTIYGNPFVDIYDTNYPLDTARINYISADDLQSNDLLQVYTT